MSARSLLDGDLAKNEAAIRAWGSPGRSAPGRFESLLRACQSPLEAAVLQRIRDLNLRLPDDSQCKLYDSDGAPVAIADFYYEPRIVVFVDGSVHYQDFVRDADERKRLVLRRLGYRVVVLRGDMMEQDLQELRDRLG